MHVFKANLRDVKMLMRKKVLIQSGKIEHPTALMEM
jgi:hypothetical protein